MTGASCLVGVLESRLRALWALWGAEAEVTGVQSLPAGSGCPVPDLTLRGTPGAVLTRQ
jgi:hypothetical protein